MGRNMARQFDAYHRAKRGYEPAHPDQDASQISHDELAEWTKANKDLIPPYSPDPKSLPPLNPFDDPCHLFYQPPIGMHETMEAYLTRLGKIMREDKERRPGGRDHFKDRIQPQDPPRTDEQEILVWMNALSDQQWRDRSSLYPPPSIPASQMASFYPEGTDLVALDANLETEHNPIPRWWVHGNSGFLPQLPGEGDMEHIGRLKARK